MHPGRKINLQEAAAIIGISKKSLDDYYYQLRLGEKYGFDFKSHMDDKIGILRMFIKDVKPKGRKKDKNEKHPKKLKILDELPDIESMSSERAKSMGPRSAGNMKDISMENKPTNPNSIGDANNDNYFG
jgi:hypothetical protein